MTRVLLLCPEPGRPAMAGVGIRFWEMARHLGRRHEVRLGFPNDLADLTGVTELAEAKVVRYDGANLAALHSWSEAVVLHAHVSNLYFASADPRAPRPLVVDLYDPFPIENLNYFPTLGDGTYRHDRATLERQLREGDLFLCSSPEQRLFYLGMLYALGRLNPETYFADFTLGNLVREVPFGIAPPEPSVPAGAAAAPAPLLRGVVPGIGLDDPILFFGGIYDWYDPMLLLAILPALMARFPTLRVVFSANPNAASTPQGTYAEVLAVAREAGWLDRHVFFVPWVAAERRFGLYREATVAVVLHRPRFEAEISLRTRVLDFLGAGLPVVATEGGAMSRLLTRGEDGLGGARGRRGGAHRGARRASRFGAAAQRARGARARLGGAPRLGHRPRAARRVPRRPAHRPAQGALPPGLDPGAGNWRTLQPGRPAGAAPRARAKLTPGVRLAPLRGASRYKWSAAIPPRPRPGSRTSRRRP